MNVLSLRRDVKEYRNVYLWYLPLLLLFPKRNSIHVKSNYIQFQKKRIVIVYEGIFIKNKVVFLKKKVSQLFIQGLNFKEMA